MKILLSSIAALAVATTSCAASEIAPPSTDSAECKEMTAKLVQATGAQFKGTSSIAVLLTHPAVAEDGIELVCWQSPPFQATLSFDGAFPTNAWFTLAAKVGQVISGVDFKALDSAIRECYRNALKAKSETDTVEFPNGGRIDCQAFTLDGGGASVTIMAEVDK